LRGRIIFAAQDSADQYRNIDLQLVRELLIGGRKGNEFNLADSVFQRRLRVHLTRTPRFCDLKPRDYAGDLYLVWLLVGAPSKYLRLGLHLARGCGVDDLEVAQLLAVLVERMAGDEEAEDFLFVLQARVLV